MGWDEKGTLRGPAGPTGPAAATAVTHTPEQYGAIGDGVANDQAALEAMLAALNAGDRVVMTKRYRHSAALTIPVPNTVWYWFGGVLLATNRQNASLRFIGPNADGTTMYGARHIVDPYTGPAADARGGTDMLTAPFALLGVKNVTLVDPYSANSAQCGFYLSGAKGFRIVRPEVNRSYADGFHMTHCCEDGRVLSPRILWPGDDGVAVVSYLLKDGAAIDPCRRIHISNPIVRYCHARGVTVVGGDDILYTDLDIQHTRAAGAAIMAESGYNTHTPQRCRMIGGTVSHVGYATISSSGVMDAGLDHGALFLFNQQNGTVMTDCRFQDIVVSDLATSAAGTGVTFVYLRSIPQSGGTFSGCGYDRITVAAGPGPTTVTGTNTGITTTGTVDNRPIVATPPPRGGKVTPTAEVSGTNVFAVPTPGLVYEDGDYQPDGVTDGLKVPAGEGGTYTILVALQLKPPSANDQTVSTARGSAIVKVGSTTIGEIGWGQNNDYRMTGALTARLAAGDVVTLQVYATATTRVMPGGPNSSLAIVKQ